MKVLRIVILQDASILQDLYPDCKYFQLPLFSNDLYQDFQKRILEICTADEANPASRISESLPLVAEAIGNANRVSRTTIVRQTNIIRDDISKLDRVISQNIHSAVQNLNLKFQFQATVNASENVSQNVLQTSGPISGETANTPTILETEHTPTASSTSAPPYSMSRCVKNIEELWNEWNVGIGNQMSIKQLEENYGALWRNGSRSTETKFYNGRKLIIDYVQSLIDDGKEFNRALEIANQRLAVCGSLNKLVKVLRQERNERNL